MSDEFDQASLKFEGERATWYRPVTLSQLLELKAAHPDAVLVNGNSEIGKDLCAEFKVQSQWIHFSICYMYMVT